MRFTCLKFIIILDRRLDTWTSIKTALARIAVRDTIQFFFIEAKGYEVSFRMYKHTYIHAYIHF